MIPKEELSVSKTPERKFSKIKLLCLNKKTPARMFLFHRDGKTNGSSLGGHVPLVMISPQVLPTSFFGLFPLKKEKHGERV